VAVKLMQQISC